MLSQNEPCASNGNCVVSGLILPVPSTPARAGSIPVARSMPLPLVGSSLSVRRIAPATADASHPLACPLVVDSNGTMLRLTAVEKPVPAPYSILAWKVSDIAATVNELAQRGVAFVRYDSLVQDDRGLWTAPDGTKVAWFLDPEGNNLSVVQFA